MKLLLTSIGKRIQLITHLKKYFQVVGVDASTENAARHFVDKFYQVPRCKDPAYVDELLRICREEKVELLVPLYEPEFPILNEARARFEACGVQLILSDSNVISICDDKRESAAFFEKYGIPAPRTLTGEEIEAILEDSAATGNTAEKTAGADASAAASFPLIIKPLDGMGSEGVFRLKNPAELAFFRTYVNSPIVQECAEGVEYTIDVLCDGKGFPVYIVPRIRLEVRSGEVSKSRTKKHAGVIAATEKLLAALRKEGRVCGPLTIQCFAGEDSISFIEINPRFGGGVPLSFEAGAEYGRAMADGRAGYAEGEHDFAEDFRELTMLRYDQAIFTE